MVVNGRSSSILRRRVSANSLLSVPGLRRYFVMCMTLRLMKMDEVFFIRRRRTLTRPVHDARSFWEYSIKIIML